MDINAFVQNLYTGMQICRRLRQSIDFTGILLTRNKMMQVFYSNK
jgi:hypothetical protein